MNISHAEELAFLGVDKMYLTLNRRLHQGCAKDQGTDKHDRVDNQNDNRDDAEELQHGAQAREATGQLTGIVSEAGSLRAVGKLEALDEGVDVDGGENQVEETRACPDD